MFIDRYEADPILSGIAVHNGIVYLAGVAAADISQDLHGQTEQVLAEIDRLLAMAGSNKSKILRVEIWLPDMSNYDVFNTQYQKWIDPDNIPARACVEARLWDYDAKVEIMVTAVV
jgi:enamine deaminase RidA (YjgF/YER057c/UK114 family)